MARFLPDLALPSGWEVWGVAVAGLFVAGLSFVVGRRLLVRAPAPAVEAPPAGPALDPFEVGSHSEKRAALRRKGSSVEVHFSDEKLARAPCFAWVTDRSLGGLGLCAEVEVPVGTVLKVRPRSAPSGTPWVEVDVRSCRSEEGGWQLHCAFKKSPPYSVLLLFG